jgi:hypothetical protein
MDPNATLAAIRQAIADVNGAQPGDSIAHFQEASLRLAEHVEVLDEWLTRGGFLPYAWAR